jgi:chorismate synthase
MIMSSNTFGENFRIVTFGESHGPALGVVIDGLRPGIAVDLEAIQRELDRRRPGQSALTSPRQERDRLEVLSGVFEGKTTGMPIAIIVRNEDARPQDYERWREVFRPGHADLTFQRKFGIRDHRGGGRSSGRETVARVAAGALARQLLARLGLQIVGHVVQIGEIVARRFDPEQIESNPLRCADAAAAQQMAAAIEAARKDGDSLGGVVEVRATGVPAGWGDPIFLKLDAQLGAALLSIGAVKGVEIGDGFALARLRGSQANDPITPDGCGGNKMGGVLGGISSGAPLVARLAVKPTPSIRIEQPTIDIAGAPRTIRAPGRHDPCICPRIVPVAESMVALVLCDAHLRQQAMLEAQQRPTEQEAELAFCDGELLRLLHRRRQVVEGAPLLDNARQAKLAALQGDLATRLGYDPAFAREFFALVDRGCRVSSSRPATTENRG